MAFWSKKDSSKETSPKHTDLGRNDPCHCGSGKKYKKCCMAKDEAAEHKVLAENWSKAEAAAQAEAEKKAKEQKNAGDGSRDAEGGKINKNPSPASRAPSPASKAHPTFVPNQVNMPRKSGGG